MSRVSVEKEALERLLNAMIGGSRCALDECPTNVSMICDDCRRLALDIQPIEEPTNAEAMLADALARVRELEREVKICNRVIDLYTGSSLEESKFQHDLAYAVLERNELLRDKWIMPALLRAIAEAESEVEG